MKRKHNYLALGLGASVVLAFLLWALPFVTIVFSFLLLMLTPIVIWAWCIMRAFLLPDDSVANRSLPDGIELPQSSPTEELARRPKKKRRAKPTRWEGGPTVGRGY